MLLGYKDWSKLYEQEESSEYMTIILSVDVTQSGQNKKRDILVYWAKAILPDMELAIKETISEIPDNIRFVLSDYGKINFSELSDNAISIILPTRAKVSIIDDNFFQDMIDDQDLNEYVNIEVYTKSIKKIMPDPHEWLGYIKGRPQGKYNLESQGSDTINELVFKMDVPYGMDPFDVLAETAEQEFMTHRLNPYKLEYTEYGGYSAVVLPSNISDMTYEKCFIGVKDIIDITRKLQQKFAYDLDRKIHTIVKGHIKSEKYFKEMLEYGPYSIQVV